MMKRNRPILFVASVALVLILLGGGVALRVGASDNSYRQAVRFAEVLSLVLENYVDPVEAEGLLRGAYEGMLGGLDPNGAFLTPEEVSAWRSGTDETLAGPGIEVLRVGRMLHVVRVDEASPAADAGIEPGDQVRTIDDVPVRDLSLPQALQRLRGAPGTTVSVGLLRSSDGFRREEIELTRRLRAGRAFRLQVIRETAVLRVLDFDRVAPGELREELEDVQSRGIDRLLLDLRNLADADPRSIAAVAGLFTEGTLLRLRDRSGRLLETIAVDRSPAAWTGPVHALVNGASAGAAEALAMVVRDLADGTVFGESTYGLGAEPGLYELENGYALLVSSRLWETDEGDRWHVDGIEPDQVVRGEGADRASVIEDQLTRVLESLASAADAEPADLPAEAA